MAKSLKMPMEQGKAISAVTQDQVKAVLDATANYALKIRHATARSLSVDFVGVGDGVHVRK